MTILPTLQSALDNGRALKIISGLHNFDADRLTRAPGYGDRESQQFLDYKFLTARFLQVSSERVPNLTSLS
ncbi:hypothetical protein [Stenomitos frigidus]|uniref:hypothetical protein n=1 Tax=Stenomitos frigidus TaxID=1886765 RepID=UPI001FEAAEAF|nr:hypothetical protein [Stenomitos frigidus]